MLYQNWLLEHIWCVKELGYVLYMQTSAIEYIPNYAA